MKIKKPAITSRKSIGPYKHELANCKDVNPLVLYAAKHAARIILSGLPTVRIEHIGSTAVEGCAGKGIIDLMILYPGGELEVIKAKLDELGFQKQSTRDPFPESRPMRVGSIEFEGELFQLHAHLIEKGNPETGELIKFRDALKTNLNLRLDYVSLKQAIIKNGITDPIDYANAKSGFIKAILAK